MIVEPFQRVTGQFPGGDTPDYLLVSDVNGKKSKITRQGSVGGGYRKVKKSANRAVYEGVRLLDEGGVGAPKFDAVQQHAPHAGV